MVLPSDRSDETTKRMKEAVIKQCSIEASRSDDEAKLLYQTRLDSEIDGSVVRPYCIPHVEGRRKKERRWVKNNRVLVGEEFNFHHHSREELINFAVSKRDDPDFLLGEMEGLYLDEFPAPDGGDPVYMVSDNGNHRRLVYACIDLPEICALVQCAPTKQWHYYWKDRSRAAAKIIIWFQYLGLIDSVAWGLDDETLIIEGRDNLVGWLLPDARLPSLSAMLLEVHIRTEALNKQFMLDTEFLTLLRSKVRRRFSIEFAYLRSRISKTAQNTSSPRPS